MRKILFILMALSFSFEAMAQSTSGVTLEYCQSKAREHYPLVAKYDLITISEKYDLSTAARGWIPQLTVSGQATWQNAVATFPEQFSQILQAMGTDMPGLSKDQYKVAVDVQQTLWDGGASKAGKNLAKAEAEEKRLANETDIYALEERVSNLFFGLLLLEENYRTYCSKKELLDRNYAKIESLCRNGLALQSDVDLIRVAQLQIEQNIDQNRESSESYRLMLEAFTGESLKGKELVKPLEAMVSSDGSNRPEMRLLDAEKSILDSRDAALKVSLMPKFAAFAQGFYGNPGLDMFSSMMSRDWTWNAVVGVRMQWNISPFFTYSIDRRRIANAQEIIGVQKDVFRFNQRLQSIQENGEIVRMRRAVANDDEIVALRRSIRSAAESQLDNGVIDTATLLERISEETMAVSLRSIHEIELLKKEYELKHTLYE